MITAIMSILWLVCGYSIALGDASPYWGGFGEIFAKNLTTDGMSDAGLPDYLVFAFQMTFFMWSQKSKRWSLPERSVCKRKHFPFGT